MKTFFLVFFLLLIVGCNDIEQQRGDMEQEEYENNYDIVEFEDLEDVAGKDPVGLPRFPDSTRTNYMEERLAFYFAQTTIDELGKFYYDFADEQGFEFELKLLENEKEVIKLQTENDGVKEHLYTIHMYPSEVFAGYVEWHIWSSEW